MPLRREINTLSVTAACLKATNASAACLSAAMSRLKDSAEVTCSICHKPMLNSMTSGLILLDILHMAFPSICTVHRNTRMLPLYCQTSLSRSGNENSSPPVQACRCIAGVGRPNEGGLDPSRHLVLKVLMTLDHGIPACTSQVRCGHFWELLQDPQLYSWAQGSPAIHAMMITADEAHLHLPGASRKLQRGCAPRSPQPQQTTDLAAAPLHPQTWPSSRCRPRPLGATATPCAPCAHM